MSNYAFGHVPKDQVFSWHTSRKPRHLAKPVQIIEQHIHTHHNHQNYQTLHNHYDTSENTTNLKLAAAENETWLGGEKQPHEQKSSSSVAFASYASTADTAHSLMDPVNAREGYVLTSDALGRGKWLPPPTKSSRADISYLSCDTLQVDPEQAKPGKVWTCVDDQGRGGWFDLPAAAPTQMVNIEPNLSELESNEPNRLSESSQSSQLSEFQSVQAENVDAQHVNTQHLNVHSLTSNQISFFEPQPSGSVLTISDNGHEIECVPTSRLLWEPLQDMFDSTVSWLDETETKQLSNLSDHSDQPGKLVASYNRQLYEIPQTFVNHQNNQLTIQGKVQLEQGSFDAPVVTAEHINTTDLHTDFATIDHLTCPTIECSNLVIHASSSGRAGQAPLSGDVLTYTHDGKAMWATPSEPLDLPCQSIPHSLVQFQDNTGKTLSGTSVMVKSCPGNANRACVSAGQFEADCDNVIMYQNQPLMSMYHGEHLALGPQCQTFSFGEGSLDQNLSGYDLVALGPNTLKSATCNKHCIALGGNALTKCKEDDTIGMGYQTLDSLQHGKNNLGIGVKVMHKSNHVHNNVGVGTCVLYANQGNNNTGVGAFALSNCVASGNSAFGNRAGSKLKFGDSNVCVGDNAGPEKDLANTIALGRDARPSESGHVALGSAKAPLRLSHEASSGNLPMLNPDAYLCVDINGVPYKIALHLV